VIPFLDARRGTPVPFGAVKREPKPRAVRATAPARKNVRSAPTADASSPSSDVIVVVTTVGTEQQALDIADHLVKNRLAACVNIFPGIRSIFRWKGKVNDDGEFFLIAKTVKARYAAVRAAMKKLNAYELPEILGFPATFADDAFAAWVAESSAPERRVKKN
jgi:periplasmic divalent cation tolerance protein